MTSFEVGVVKFVEDGISAINMGRSESELSVEEHIQDTSRRQPATTPGMHPADVLAQLCVLLDEYAPTWYSEKMRRRMLEAVRLPTEVLVEVCALLEDHAPIWYTERQRGRALGALQILGLLEENTPEESK